MPITIEANSIKMKAIKGANTSVVIKKILFYEICIGIASTGIEYEKKTRTPQTERNAAPNKETKPMKKLRPFISIALTTRPSGATNGTSKSTNDPLRRTTSETTSEKKGAVNRNGTRHRQRRTERSETPKAPSSKYQYNGSDESKRGDERRNRPTSSRRHIETLNRRIEHAKQHRIAGRTEQQ